MVCDRQRGSQASCLVSGQTGVFLIHGVHVSVVGPLDASPRGRLRTKATNKLGVLLLPLKARGHILAALEATPTRTWSREAAASVSGHGQTVHVARLSSRSPQPPRPRSQPGLKRCTSSQARGDEAQRCSKRDMPSAVRGSEETCRAARAAPHDCPALGPPRRVTSSSNMFSELPWAWLGLSLRYRLPSTVYRDLHFTALPCTRLAAGCGSKWFAV